MTISSRAVRDPHSHRHGHRAGQARFASRSARHCRGRVVKMDEILQTIQAKLKELLAQPEQPIAFAASGPTVIMVVGVNGTGKTTSIAKLAHMFQRPGQAGGPGRGRHLPGGGRRATDRSGPSALGVEIVKGDQAATRPASPIARSRGRWKPEPKSASWIPRAGCKPRPI